MPIKSFSSHLVEAAFTRQHYQALAAVIKKARQHHPGGNADSALDMIAGELAQLFARDNPNFRADQFVNATKK
ncbi:MAG: hypothetical protein FJ267_09245 [Planctomycetes bacterium]|nr:hypothetical protein [Planctomycetota bacterium]